MKRLTFILCVILIGGTLVGAGWYLGHSRRATDEAYTKPVIDKRIEDAVIAAKLLHDLDTGNTNEIRSLLQFQIIVAVTHLDYLSEMTDARSRELAGNVVAQIAKYRAEGSPSFTGDLGNWTGNSIAGFEAALKRLSAERKK